VTEGLAPDATHGSVDPEVPFASLFNAEPGYPLLLEAPAIESARLSLEGLQLEVVFDMQTLRGVRMVDNYGGDNLWDTCSSPSGVSVNITPCTGILPGQDTLAAVDCSQARRDCSGLIPSGVFNCSLVFDDATIALIGHYDDGTYCSYVDKQSPRGFVDALIVDLDKNAIIDVGMEISLKSNVIF
jgi:hypothetical protein